MKWAGARTSTHPPEPCATGLTSTATTLSCASACGYYKYIALQNDGWCSCDNDLYHATQYGQAKFCGGKGGSWCNYIYNNPFALEKVGAYFDDVDRALSEYKGDGYDPHSCAMACIGYKYIGLQFFRKATGSQCFCGDDLQKSEEYGAAPESGGIKILEFPDSSCPMDTREVMSPSECKSLADSNGPCACQVPSL